MFYIYLFIYIFTYNNVKKMMCYEGDVTYISMPYFVIVQSCSYWLIYRKSLN